MNQVNQNNSKEGFKMFNNINTVKGILSLVVASLVVVGMSSIAQALPDLIVQDIQLRSSFITYGYIANIGDQMPFEKVSVYAQLDFYNCYTGATASLKKLGKFSPSYFGAGTGAWVRFGPFRIKQGWILTRIFMMVDPYNQIAENSGDNNTNTSYVNSGCFASDSTKVAPAAKPSKSMLQLENAKVTQPEQNSSAQVEILTLNGQKVYTQTTSGNGLSAEELSRVLPNGVYLYTLTVRNANGAIIKREVHKLAITK